MSSTHYGALAESVNSKLAQLVADVREEKGRLQLELDRLDKEVLFVKTEIRKLDRVMHAAEGTGKYSSGVKRAQSAHSQNGSRRREIAEGRLEAILQAVKAHPEGATQVELVSWIGQHVGPTSSDTVRHGLEILINDRELVRKAGIRRRTSGRGGRGSMTYKLMHDSGNSDNPDDESDA